jgi:hypothetical protein
MSGGGARAALAGLVALGLALLGHGHAPLAPAHGAPGLAAFAPLAADLCLVGGAEPPAPAAPCDACAVAKAAAPPPTTAQAPRPTRVTEATARPARSRPARARLWSPARARAPPVPTRA